MWRNKKTQQREVTCSKARRSLEVEPHWSVSTWLQSLLSSAVHHFTIDCVTFSSNKKTKWNQDNSVSEENRILKSSKKRAQLTECVKREVVKIEIYQ